MAAMEVGKEWEGDVGKGRGTTEKELPFSPKKSWEQTKVEWKGRANRRETSPHCHSRLLFLSHRRQDLQDPLFFHRVTFQAPHAALLFRHLRSFPSHSSQMKSKEVRGREGKLSGAQEAAIRREGKRMEEEGTAKRWQGVKAS